MQAPVLEDGKVKSRHVYSDGLTALLSLVLYRRRETEASQTC
jgi:hypothetical protein